MSENLVTLGGAFSEGYGIVPKKLMKSQEVSAYSKLILAYMLSYTGAGNECFPGIDTIKNDLQLSKSTIIRGIKDLCDKKWIVKERMYPDNPLKHNNKYVLTCISEVSTVDLRGVLNKPPRCPEQTSEVSTVDKNNNIYNNNINNNNIDNKDENASHFLSTFKQSYTNIITKHGISTKAINWSVAIKKMKECLSRVSIDVIERSLSAWELDEFNGIKSGFDLCRFEKNLAKYSMDKVNTKKQTKDFII